MATKPAQVKFNNIKYSDQPFSVDPSNVRNLRKVQQFQIGNGSKVWHADRNGMWLGAEKFADTPFRVDMEGNVVGITFDAVEVTGLIVYSGVLNSSEINGGTIAGATITGGLFRTAADGIRIEIDSENNQNEIRFYDATTLYATLRVRTESGDGYVEIKDPNGAGFEVLSGVGASGYGSASIMSLGGTIATSGNATNSFNGLIGRGGVTMLYVGNQSGGSDYIFAANLPTSSSGLPSGAIWNDGGTLKIA